MGTLLAGLLVGHLRTHYPLFGRIPDGAVALMTSLGLAAFVGLTGICAGPIFLTAAKEAGTGLLLGGLMVTLMPQVVGFLFGHFVLRLNPIFSPRSAGRSADSHGGDGGRARAFRKCRCRVGLYASISDREYPSDDLGHRRGCCNRRLNPFFGMCLI